jgi:uncharacterized protein YggU (UPF0235/DUF167 family)
VWTSAAPVDGRANDAACRLLAAQLRVPNSTVRVIAGHRARTKTVDVEGLTLQEAMDRLHAAP